MNRFTLRLRSHFICFTKNVFKHAPKGSSESLTIWKYENRNLDIQKLVDWLWQNESSYNNISMFFLDFLERLISV